MGKRIPERLWWSGCDSSIFWGHRPQVSTIIDKEGMVRKQVYQIIKIVCQWGTVLDNHATILSICKVVFGQVCSCNQDIIVEDMSLDMMDAENFSKARLWETTLHETSVRHVKEANSHLFVEWFQTELFQHCHRRFGFLRKAGTPHVIQ